MRLSSSAAVLGFLLVSAPALAGEVYSFTFEKQGGGDSALTGDRLVLDGTTKGRVILDGRKYRLELAPDPESARPYQAAVSKDGGEHEIALDLAKHTFYEPKAAAVTSSLLRLLPVGNGTASNVKLEAVEAPETEMVAGAQARRHAITLSYDIAVELSPPAGLPGSAPGHSEIVRGKVRVDAVYWLAAGRTPVLPQLLRPEIRTGFPEIDTQLATAVAALQGIPVKQQVTISTEGDQGTAAQISVRTVLLEGHRTQETKASLFEVPSGFKKHEPEIVRPGFGGV